ncbi:replication-relaxation family protein, partial [Frankia sp. CiP3]|uniref:replication-relaxation family protein n=1 Tax=Frankia sp. CiP3 TaxID=2880971 RepID=UPI0035B1F9C9
MHHTPVRSSPCPIKKSHHQHTARTCGVQEFFTDLAGYARTHPGARLDTWRPARTTTTRAVSSSPTTTA